MFVAIEGIDGSGKSTQAALLYSRLKANGKCFLTSEPTERIVGSVIRKFVSQKRKKDPMFLQLLFVADRADHMVNVIMPKLNSKFSVITDRYVCSTISYGVASGLDEKWLMEINRKFMTPDVTILLDVDPRVVMKRIRKRKKARSYFEQHIGFQENKTRKQMVRRRVLFSL